MVKLNAEDTDNWYGIFVNGEHRGRAWFARGVKSWGALVRVNIKAVPRRGPDGSLESLKKRVAKDFKGKTVEFRLEPKL